MWDLFGNHIIGFPTRRHKYRLCFSGFQVCYSFEIQVLFQGFSRCLSNVLQCKVFPNALVFNYLSTPVNFKDHSMAVLS